MNNWKVIGNTQKLPNDIHIYLYRLEDKKTNIINRLMETITDLAEENDIYPMAIMSFKLSTSSINGNLEKIFLKLKIVQQLPKTADEDSFTKPDN